MLLPFRAFRSRRPTLYVPGEEPPRPLRATGLVQDARPALFLYRQRFRFPQDETESIRDGVMGVLNRAVATVFRHEETIPDRVAGCARAIRSGDADPGSLWLWCHDSESSLTARFDGLQSPEIEVRDRFGCLHQLWTVSETSRIRDLQSALEGKALFLADGHHRFAAGWNLATIQIRGAALRSRPSHRLVTQDGPMRLPATQPVEDIERYLAAAPAGQTRYVVVRPGPEFGGFELPREMPLQQVMAGATIQPIRDLTCAVAAVQSGEAPLALLVAPFSIDRIEQQACHGILLAPKSTDFYPKLAAGLIMHRSDSHPRLNKQRRLEKRTGVGETCDMHAPSAYVT